MPALRRREPGLCRPRARSSAASSCRPRAPRRSGPASAPRSIRFTTTRLRRARADRLGRLGLSAAKIKTLKNLARELAAERLNLEVLANEDADAAHNTLTALHGIGPWTADVYLLVLPRPWRRLAGRRSRRAGGGQDRPRPEDAADRKADGAAGRAVAAAARRRGASVVELLPGAEEARRRDRRGKADVESVAATCQNRAGRNAIEPRMRLACAGRISAVRGPERYRFRAGKTPRRRPVRETHMLDKTDDISTAAENWLAQFETALAEPDDATALKTLFHPDSYWRDVLALSWNIQTVNGARCDPERVEAPCAAAPRRAALRSIPTAPRRAG